MDREAFDRSLARRLLHHIEHRTTDLAEDVMELPADVYTSPEHLEREVEALFLDQPLLCLSGALPGPGSYVTVDVCGTPVLVTRDGDGKVRAMANACRHRGVRVVDGRGKARRFTCPFHAWTYDMEGTLVGLPTASAFDGMCREDKGLVPLPVAEGYGLVVGRLRPGEPVDVDEYLGPGLSEELALLDFAGWGTYGEAHVHDVGANWKVTLDTFRENYHFDHLHRTTLASYAYGGVPSSASSSSGRSVCTGTIDASSTTIASANVPQPHTAVAVRPSGRSNRSAASTAGPSSQWLDRPLRHHQHDPQAGETDDSTRSPTAARRASGPTASTTPQPSWPGTIGSGRFDSPRITVRSVWQIPLAESRTSTSRGPIAGVGRSSTTSGPLS
jgi:phenylpropionate dioxygenase-like ring-hydroxylating dioxygenase large terminal subunit